MYKWSSHRIFSLQPSELTEENPQIFEADTEKICIAIHSIADEEGWESTQITTFNKMDFSFVKWTHATFNDIGSYGNHSIERYRIENLMNTQAWDYFYNSQPIFPYMYLSISRIQISIESKWLTNQQSTSRKKIRNGELQCVSSTLIPKLNWQFTNLTVCVMLCWILKWHKPFRDCPLRAQKKLFQQRKCFLCVRGFSESLCILQSATYHHG